MSSPEWLVRIERLVRDALHPSFTVSLIPSDLEGDQFLIQSEAKSWRAVILGRVRWRGLDLSYEPRGFGSFLVQQAAQAAASGVLSDALGNSLLVETNAQSRVLSDNRIYLPGELRTASISQNLRIETSFAPFVSRRPATGIDVRAILPRLGGFLQAVVSACPTLEATVAEGSDPAVVTEGTKSTSTTTTYERSPLARAICIAVKGDACSVCAMRFEDRYGEIGAGYVHVHHLKPLASYDGMHAVNPLTDLVPVCANCHAMLHKRNPPLTPDELKSLLH